MHRGGDGFFVSRRILKSDIRGSWIMINLCRLNYFGHLVCFWGSKVKCNPEI